MPKRIFQLRSSGGGGGGGGTAAADVTLVSLESLALVAEEAFDSACAASPLQLAWQLALSPRTSDPGCTVAIVAETPFVVLLRNGNCMLTAVDVEAGTLLWTAAHAMWSDTSVSPCRGAGETSASGSASPAVLLFNDTRVAFVPSATASQILVLSVRSGAVVATLSASGGPALGPCLWASSLAPVGATTVAATRTDGTSVVSVTVPATAGPPAADASQQQPQLFSRMMRALVVRALRPPPSWRPWAFFWDWDCVSTAGLSANAPTWSFAMRGSQQRAGSAPRLIMLDAEWVANATSVSIVDAAAVGSSRTVFGALPSQSIVLRNVGYLVGTIAAPICAPTPGYAFVVADMPDAASLTVALVPGAAQLRDRAPCSAATELYESFEVSGSSVVAADAAAWPWQSMLHSCRSLALRRANLAGPLPLSSEMMTLASRQFPGSTSAPAALDLSGNPDNDGPMFASAWPSLQALNLAGTGVSSPVGGSPYALTLHSVRCDATALYNLVSINVSGCRGLRGVLAMSTGSDTCVPSTLSQVDATGIQIVDAVDVRLSREQAVERAATIPVRVDVILDADALRAAQSATVVCAGAVSPVRLVSMGGGGGGAATSQRWDPCSDLAAPSQPSSTTATAGAFNGFIVVDAANTSTWLPMHPMCAVVALPYATGNFDDNRVLNATNVTLQLYPSLTKADELTLSVHGAPGVVSDATVMGRVNSFAAFADNNTRSDVLCGVAPLHWWLARASNSTPPAAAAAAATNATAAAFDFVFAASMKASLTACMDEILKFVGHNASKNNASRSRSGGGGSVAASEISAQFVVSSGRRPSDPEAATSRHDQRQMADQTCIHKTVVCRDVGPWPQQGKEHRR